MELAVCLLLLSACAAAKRHDGNPLVTPAYLVIGKSNGDILRCPFHELSKCEIINNGKKNPTDGSSVYSFVVHGEILFVGLRSNIILRCEWNRVNSCTVHYKYKGSIYSLLVSNGHLYAGTEALVNTERMVLRCGLTKANSCSTISHIPNHAVSRMFKLNKYIYASMGRALYCCPIEASWRCSKVKKNDEVDIASVSHMANYVITVPLKYNDVMYYKMTSGNLQFVKKFSFPNHQFNGSVTNRITTFRRNSYVLMTNGDIMESVGENFTLFVHHTDLESVTFVYSTHQLANRFSYISGCSSLPRTPDQFEYGLEDRVVAEVDVVDGLLWDARRLVDTRRADLGYSGRVAVFAMGPGGQLLLSHAHRSGLFHIASFFAGGPVAGAGEIIVEQGVVKRIIACSTQYWPSIRLNRQVVDELFKRGYTRADEIVLKRCNYSCE